jgi:hypothetical protein
MLSMVSSTPPEERDRVYTIGYVVNAPRRLTWSVMVLQSPEELSVYRSGGSVVAEAHQES